MTRRLRAIRALGGAPRPPERRGNVPTLDPLMSNGGQNPPCSKGRYGRKFRRFCQEDGVVRGGREEGRGTPVFPSACGFADQGATLVHPRAGWSAKPQAAQRSRSLLLSQLQEVDRTDRKSTRLNSSHL